MSCAGARIYMCVQNVSLYHVTERNKTKHNHRSYIINHRLLDYSTFDRYNIIKCFCLLYFEKYISFIVYRYWFQHK